MTLLGREATQRARTLGQFGSDGEEAPLSALNHPLRRAHASSGSPLADNAKAPACISSFTSSAKPMPGKDVVTMLRRR